MTVVNKNQVIVKHCLAIIFIHSYTMFMEKEKQSFKDWMLSKGYKKTNDLTWQLNNELVGGKELYHLLKEYKNKTINDL